tara:strand:- start:7234 stop:7797 length:564 start_codon:yes stop_codon:yes gene_type:complete
MAQFASIGTYSGTEVISLSEAKEYLRVGHSTDDTYITELIKIARVQITNDTRAAVVANSIVETCRDWPDNDILHLTYAGIVSSVAVVYRNSANAVITMDAADYRLINHDGLPMIEFINTYPLFDRQDAISISYTCSPHNEYTKPLKIAMLMLIQNYYDNRSPVSYLKVDELPLGYKNIVNQYKNYDW